MTRRKRHRTKRPVRKPAERVGDSSVIATPGPPSKPTKSDEDFIASSDEDVGLPDADGGDDPDNDPDMDTTDGTDGDEEGKLEESDPQRTEGRAKRKAVRKAA